MKKIIALILLVCTIPLFASAEPDLSSMTDAELLDLLIAVRGEYSARTAPVNPNSVIVEDDLIRIYATGSAKHTTKTFSLEVVFENNTDQEAGIYFKHIIINGWETTADTIITLVNAHRKTKAIVTFHFDEADLASFREMETLELSFELYGPDNKSIREYSLPLYFHGSDWN